MSDESTLESLVRASVADVFQTMAFMLVDDDADDNRDIGTSEVQCHVDITGPWHGELTFWTTPSFAREATANLLGIEADEVKEDMVPDAVREIGNMIAGSIATGLCETGEVFDLSVPVYDTASPPPPTPPGEGILLALEAEYEHPFLVHLRIRHDQ